MPGDGEPAGRGGLDGGLRPEQLAEQVALLGPHPVEQHASAAGHVGPQAVRRPRGGGQVAGDQHGGVGAQVGGVEGRRHVLRARADGPEVGHRVLARRDDGEGRARAHVLCGHVHQPGQHERCGRLGVQLLAEQ